MKKEIPAEDNGLLKKIKEELTQQEIVKSSLMSRFDLLLAIAKAEMEGDKKTCQIKLRDRIKKFFDYGEYGIDIEKGNFCDKIQPNYVNPKVTVSSSEIMLFGIDFLSTRRIISLFPQPKPIIKWVNSSNCKAIFPNPEIAMKALESIVDRSIHPQFPNIDKNNLPHTWFQCCSYRQLTFYRRIQCRFATSEEVIVGNVNQKMLDYEMYKRAKKNFEKDLFLQYSRKYPQLLMNRNNRQQRNYQSQRSRQKMGRNNQQRNNMIQPNRHQSSRYRNKKKCIIIDEQSVHEISSDSDQDYSQVLKSNSMGQSSMINRFDLMNLQASFSNQKQNSIGSNSMRNRFDQMNLSNFSNHNYSTKKQYPSSEHNLSFTSNPNQNPSPGPGQKNKQQYEFTYSYFGKEDNKKKKVKKSVNAAGKKEISIIIID